MASSTIITVLKAHHLSATEPRQAVYTTLSRSDPLTMQELIAALPNLNKTTVYRTIELFEQLGVVQRLTIGWKYKLELSNQYQEHHHHASCVRCGTLVDLPEDPALEKQLSHLARNIGFTPQDHQLEIRGLCAECQKIS